MSTQSTGDQVAGEMSGKIFVRKASGLVRDFSTFDLLVANMSDCSVGFTFLTGALWAASLYPDAKLLPLVIIGAIMLVFVGVVYSFFAASMPRSGGDYVWVGRVLHPLLGFVTNWAHTWGMLLGAGLFAWLFIDTLASILVTAGLQLGNAGLQSLGESLTSTGSLFGLGTVLIVLVTIIQLAGKKFLRGLLRVLFWVGVVALVVHLGVMLSATNEEFVASFNQFMGSYTNSPDSYNYIIDLAKEKGSDLPQGSWAGTLIALPLAFQFYIGFTATAYVAGEAKEPFKSQPRAMIATLAISLLVLAVGFQGMYRVVGRDLINGLAFLDGIGENPVPVGIFSTFFTGLLSTNPTIELVTGLALLAWPLALVIVLMMLPVRNLFAWSFDRLLPDAVTKVDKGGTPVIATIIISVLTWLIMILYLYTTIFELSLGLTAITSIGFILVGVAAFIFPSRRKDIFDRSAQIVKSKIGKTPVIAICGVIMAIIYTITFVSAVVNEGFGLSAWIFTFILFGIAIAIYFGAKAIRKKQQVDLNLLWEELPPD